MKKEPLTLAIDTSCDETSASVIRGFTVLSNIQPSQMEFHKKYGGVVPSLAKLAHIDRIDNVVNEALKRANIKIEDLDYFSVTEGPGLAIALEVGINKAKELSNKYKKFLVAENHMLGHLYSALAEPATFTGNIFNESEKIKFPILGFLISGGHTELILVKNFDEYKKIGETLDDSCGEAYDKCGRMLGLGYPAGPVISRFANVNRKNVDIKIVRHNQSTLIIATNKNSKAQYSLPIPMINSGDLNFSFSGLKTAFKQVIDGLGELSKEQIMDLCVVFEAAALTQLSIKLDKAIKQYNPTEVFLGGGVVASARLRSVMRSVCKSNSLKMRFPYTRKLTTDNASMIGIASNIRVLNLGGVEKINEELKVNSEQLKSEKIYFENLDLIDRKPSLSL